VFLITPAFAPDATEMGLNLVGAAQAAGVRKIVYNGVYHPSLGLANHASTRRSRPPAWARCSPSTTGTGSTAATRSCSRAILQHQPRTVADYIAELGAGRSR
jgi:hypothetical protein